MQVWIFPRIGYTRYWSKYQDYVNSMPAIVSWGLGLVFGFGLNYLDVMSFYYLFIPTWFFTILLYTFLAGRSGANKSYPQMEKKENEYNTAVEQYHEKLAAVEIKIEKDTSILTKTLRITAFAALAVTLYLALKVLFASADEAEYISNRATFYQIGFVCTILYFVVAYWAMQRGKSFKIN